MASPIDHASCLLSKCKYSYIHFFGTDRDLGSKNAMSKEQLYLIILFSWQNDCQTSEDVTSLTFTSLIFIDRFAKVKCDLTCLCITAVLGNLFKPFSTVHVHCKLYQIFLTKKGMFLIEIWQTLQSYGISCLYRLQ